MTRIAVVGGTGVVGRLVVDELERAGLEARVLARSRGIDAYSGAGLAAALESVAAVIDVSSIQTNSRRAAVDFFEQVTRNLSAAERAAGVGHHVALSIVGIDRVGIGYYQGKRRQEELVRSGEVPWTIVRATQFHEFADQVSARLRGPVLPVPSVAVRPIAAREVAQVLVELATGAAQGDAPALAGPEVLRMPDMVRRVLRARGVRRVVVPLHLPRRVWPPDGLLPGPGYRAGQQTFGEWVEASAPAKA